MDLISVIIPCYNHETFVEEAILSVYKQDYNKIELIIIDDNSADNSYEKICRLLENGTVYDRFFRVVVNKNKENIGAHATLNKGLSLASGKYISLMNSDDIYHQNRLSVIISMMKAKHRDFAFSNYHLITDQGALFIDQFYLELQNSIRMVSSQLPSIGFIFLQQQIALSTGNFIFTKELHGKIGDLLPLKYCHDWDFVLRAITLTEPLFVDEPLYHYRVHTTNSYKSLGALADSESQFVLSSYFTNIGLMKTENSLAPAPYNWPGVFDVFIEKCGLMDMYLSTYHGYSPRHMTVEKTAFE